jgi:PKD repeat protein
MLIIAAPVSAMETQYDYEVSFTHNITSGMGSQTNYHVYYTFSNLSGVSGCYTGGNGFYPSGQVCENIIYTNTTTRPDWVDINATDESNTPLNFWPLNNTATAHNITVLVNVPAISTANTSISKWRYGNLSQTLSTADGLNTFPFWEDFLGASLNTTKWTLIASSTVTQTGGIATVSTTQTLGGGILGKTGFLPNYTIISRWKQSATPTSGTYPSSGFIDVLPSYLNGAVLFAYDGTGHGKWATSSRNAGSQTLIESATAVDTNYHVTKIDRFSSSVNGTFDGTLLGTVTANLNTTGSLLPTVYVYNSGSNVLSDWVIVTKSLVIPPSTSCYSTTILRTPASFTYNKTSGAAPLAVQFNDTSVNFPAAWTWIFTNVTGNNTAVSFSTLQNPVYTFGVGNFLIALNASTSTSFNISTQISWVNVTADVTPLTMFTKSRGVLIFPGSVQFNDTSLNTPTAWNWSFGDGTYSEVRNASHQYVKRGRWAVLLNTSNTAGYNTNTSNVWIIGG